METRCKHSELKSLVSLWREGGTHDSQETPLVMAPGKAQAALLVLTFRKWGRPLRRVGEVTPGNLAVCPEGHLF